MFNARPFQRSSPSWSFNLCRSSQPLRINFLLQCGSPQRCHTVPPSDSESLPDSLFPPVCCVRTWRFSSALRPNLRKQLFTSHWCNCGRVPSTGGLDLLLSARCVSLLSSARARRGLFVIPNSLSFLQSSAPRRFEPPANHSLSVTTLLHQSCLFTAPTLLPANGLIPRAALARLQPLGLNSRL